MSRKDFIETARILLIVADVSLRRALAEEFVEMFRRQNSRFCRNRFFEACCLDP